MSINCCKCDSDLEDWNTNEYRRINYCPHCGIKLSDERRDSLWCLATDNDIDNHVRGNLLDLFDGWGGSALCADELAERAWESENCNGVVFCSNYEADRFVMRHMRWVDEALEYACDTFGEGEHLTKMKAECNDRFLVVAFIEATRAYLYDQLGIDQDEGKLSKKRIREIIAQIKDTPYKAVW